MKKTLLKICIFCLLFAILFSAVQSLLNIRGQHYGRKYLRDFYDEPYDTIDAVYIGSSNTYSFWQAPLAWKDHGIAVCAFAASNHPVQACVYEMEEIRKTQPNAMFIMNINSFKDMEVHLPALHCITDFMPFSSNKLQLIRDLAPQCGVYGIDQFEFLFPIIRFHSSWYELTGNDFIPLNYYKGGAYSEAFLGEQINITNSLLKTGQRLQLTEQQSAEIEKILSYCDENSVRVLFVTVPQAVTNTSILAQFNTLSDLIRARGYDVLDMDDVIDGAELALDMDYLDSRHVNVHGSIKYTDFLAQYLCDHFNLTDKRGDPRYTSWDEAAENYTDILIETVPAFELEHAPRYYSLAVPQLTQLRVTGTSFQVQWAGVDHADGYDIYRRFLHDAPEAQDRWELAASVDAETFSYTDKGLQLNCSYSYTVVPFTEDSDGKAYGKYDTLGLTDTTILDMPKLISLEEEPGGIRLKWQALPDAHGYYVYRKIPGQYWNVIADTERNTEYLDDTILDGLPYQYAVAGYQLTDEGKLVGYHAVNGLLYMQDLAAPQLQAEATPEGGALLMWNAIDGATTYYVYRQIDDGEWERIASSIHPRQPEYLDPDPLAGGEGARVSYRVCAVLSFGSDRLEYPSNDVLFLPEGGAA